jgi:hemoglobin
METRKTGIWFTLVSQVSQDDEGSGSDGGQGGPQKVTVYEAVGGEPFFVSLVNEFYARIETDEVLRPSYPSDLTQSKQDLTQFLVQYWGGPTTYSDNKGHPRLRMRHAPFAIGMAEREVWLRHMTAAVDATSPPEQVRALFDQYFEQASLAMVNQPV